MLDYLDILAIDAKETLNRGYYEVSTQGSASPISLTKAIIEKKQNAVITEIKVASPSRGTIRENFDLKDIAMAMETGGAVGISVLTEPKHFNGSLSNLAEVRGTINLPILMKDIFIDPKQIQTASTIGANIVLLIEAIFKRGYCKLSLEEMISEAHKNNLEVLLETHKEEEFQHALETQADLVGINNRDLRTLKIDLNVTERILNEYSDINKIIVSESGIMSPTDLLFLRECGAQAFLIGSALMMTDNIRQKVREFVTAN